MELSSSSKGNAASQSSMLSMLRDLPNRSRLLVIVLALPAVLSLGLGVFEALHRSIDLQWSCARIVAMGQDPWKIAAAGNPHHQIIFGQMPGYLPELYLVLLPLGLMSFSTASMVWVGVSIALSFASLRMTIKMFELTPTQALICSAVFLASTPLRVALANGQQSTLVLAFLVAAFYCTSRAWKGVWLGLSYFKYSFAPVVVLTWLLDRRYRVLLCSLLAPVVGMIGVYVLTGSPLSDLVLGPARSAEMFFKGSYGFGDVMSFAKILVVRSGTNNAIWLHFPEVLALFASIGAAIYSHRLKTISEPVRAALMMTLTLLVFRHLIYDFIVLLLPFAAALASKKAWARSGVFAVIAYFWFGSSMVNRLTTWPSLPLIAANCIGLSVLTGLIRLL